MIDNNTPKIHIMDDNLSNKIAAGEVVESVVNVVKELVENSIDAQATQIIIELKESGIDSICVNDNGNGMNKEDALLCLKRHATSKIKDVNDLFYIQTLGFRGEALPSISSVSKMIIRTSNGVDSTEVIVENNKITSKSSSFNKGTTIIVNDLFYNTPVRLKYLKNPYIELSKIVDYITRMCMSYTNVAFKLINNDKKLIETSGNNDLLKVIYNLYGPDITKKMIEIKKENDDYYISGYISYPEIVRSTSNAINIFVNGRVIKNYEINKTILEAYHTYIHKGKYPIIILNIDVDPILIDINIHPTKMDIKFSKFDNLKELIKEEIEDKLENLTLIPNYSTRYEEDNILLKESIENKKANDNIIKIKTKKIKEEKQKFDFNIEEPKIKYDNKKEEHKEENIDEIQKQNRIKMMEPKGIIFLTYIIAENEDGMFLIDQHAAAERYNYERFMKEMSKKEKDTIDLLVPIKIDMTKSESIIIKKHLDILKNIGITVEEFGDNTFMIRAIPTWLKGNKDIENIKTIFEIISTKEKFDIEKFIENTATIMSCRLSVKAHDYITLDEARIIINNLRTCENPFTCPHGRPTIISYTKDEIDKMFKRDYKD